MKHQGNPYISFLHCTFLGYIGVLHLVGVLQRQSLAGYLTIEEWSRRSTAKSQSQLSVTALCSVTVFSLNPPQRFMKKCMADNSSTSLRAPACKTCRSTGEVFCLGRASDQRHLAHALPTPLLLHFVRAGRPKCFSCQHLQPGIFGATLSPVSCSCGGFRS